MVFLQIAVGGLLIGAVYALMAAGLALALGVGKLVNFSHGTFYTLGAYLVFFVYSRQAPLFWALPLAAGCAFLLGLGLARVVAPLRAWMDATAVLTLGLAILGEQIVQAAWGPFYHSLPSQGTFHLGGLILQRQEVLAGAVALTLVASLAGFLRTRLGLGLRVAALDEEIALLGGFNVAAIRQLALGASAAVAAVAGALLAPLGVIFPSMGRTPLLLSIVIVVVGGFRTPSGTLITSLLLGLAGALISFYLAPSWAYVGTMLLLAGSLAIRPQGLMP
jgi:branched-chain amino acid transport system permease protein